MDPILALDRPLGVIMGCCLGPTRVHSSVHAGKFTLVPFIQTGGGGGVEILPISADAGGMSRGQWHLDTAEHTVWHLVSVPQMAAIITQDARPHDTAVWPQDITWGGGGAQDPCTVIPGHFLTGQQSWNMGGRSFSRKDAQSPVPGTSQLLWEELGISQGPSGQAEHPMGQSLGIWAPESLVFKSQPWGCEDDPIK